MPRLTLCFLCFLLGASPLQAQSFSFDARKVALGDVAGTDQLSSEMVDPRHPYGSFFIPLGLFQVLATADRVVPGSDSFDAVAAIDYVFAPVHYVVGRGTGSNGGDFLSDLRDGRVNRDLTVYRGFLPVDQPSMGGLCSPSFGGALKLHQNETGSYHRIYVGAGPYIAVQAGIATNDAFNQIFGGDQAVYPPNAQARVTSASEFEAAAAVTVGYRGRFLWNDTASPSARDGLYVAVNYNFLGGFRYEGVDGGLRLDTDGAGLLTVNLAQPSPLLATRNSSSSGQGRAIDAGVTAVVGRWDIGGGFSGLLNEITWTGVRQTTHSMANIIAGEGTLVSSAAVPGPDVRATVPVDVRGTLAYHADRWSVLTAAGRGFPGTTFHIGYERQVVMGTVRTGIFYTSGAWQPTAGVGINLSRRAALDLAVFGSSANIERERHVAIAASIRIEAKPETAEQR